MNMHREIFAPVLDIHPLLCLKSHRCMLLLALSRQAGSQPNNPPLKYGHGLLFTGHCIQPSAGSSVRPHCTWSLACGFKTCYPYLCASQPQMATDTAHLLADSHRISMHYSAHSRLPLIGEHRITSAERTCTQILHHVPASLQQNQMPSRAAYVTVVVVTGSALWRAVVNTNTHTIILHASFSYQAAGQPHRSVAGTVHCHSSKTPADATPAVHVTALGQHRSQNLLENSSAVPHPHQMMAVHRQPDRHGCRCTHALLSSR
jgi:hypothetical protein